MKESTYSFFDNVHAVARMIPHGRVTSYGAIAKALGAGKSARMVGWAMNQAHTAQPPVPAHRVVNRLGCLTGKMHFDPPSAMQERLEAEGITVIDDQIQDFKTLFWDPAEAML